MPSSFNMKDLTRLLNGLSLVANEIVKPVAKADLETLIKKAVLSATDVSGITRGKVRQFSNPQSSNASRRANDSVVYFTDPSLESDSQPPKTTTTTINDSSAVVFPSEESRRVVEDSGAAAPVVVVSDASVCSGKEREARSSEGKVNVNGKEGGEGSGEVAPATPLRRRRPRERKVPATPFSRALGFAGLGAGLAWGTLQESARRLAFGAPSSQANQSALSPFLSDKNAERLALALCRMRGAALKIGQMLSIQDESLVPAPILAALEIVRQGADVMPKSQLNQVLNAELGPDWSSKLISFDYEPIAAASIGQVHQAVMKDGMQVAIKIQYPGVADSIESDIENVKLLLNYTNLIPQGLYLDRAIKVAKEELSRECDYKLEAASQKRFRDLLSGMEGFYVPVVVDDISSRRVLTTELVHGITIDKVALLDQETRNYIGKKLLELTLRELFVFRFMQVSLIDDDMLAGDQAFIGGSKLTSTLWNQFTRFSKDMQELLHDQVYVINVLGYISYNFVIGAYSYWGPKAGYSIYHMSNADLLFGGITIVCGILGTLSGGLILDKMTSTISNAFTLLSGATFLGAIFCLIAFCFRSLSGFIALFSIGELLIFATQAPVNYISLHCVKPSLRPLSMAISTVSIHIFGDVPSSPLVGILQDHFNDWRKTALCLTSIFFLAAGIWFIGIFLKSVDLFNEDDEDQSATTRRGKMKPLLEDCSDTSYEA